MTDELLNPEVAKAPEADEITKVDETPEIDILKLAKPNCRHCHGRGIIGHVTVKPVGTGVANKFGKEIITSKKLEKAEEVLCSCVVNRVERMERFVEKAEKQQKLLNEEKNAPTLDKVQ